MGTWSQMNISGKITDFDECEPFLKKRKQLCCNMPLSGSFINIITFMLFLQLRPSRLPLRPEFAYEGQTTK